MSTLWQKDIHRGDRLFQFVLRACAIAAMVLLLFMVVNLGYRSWPAFKVFGLKFFVSSDWDPVNDQFGVVSFVYGTLVSSALALLIAVPVSVGSALCLTELAPRRISAVLGFLIEMLAAIPSVVYGLWGIFVLAPLMRETVQPFLGKYLGWIPLFSGPAYGVGMLTAGILLAIMIIPTILSISREVFFAIPRAQREAALALGATRFETLWIAVVKSSVSGLFGASVLGLARAFGETMAVTMVIGNRAEVAVSLFAPGQTMASVIANEYAEATTDIHLAALGAVGVTLFLVSWLINSTARAIVSRSERRGGAGGR